MQFAVYIFYEYKILIIAMHNNKKLLKNMLRDVCIGL